MVFTTSELLLLIIIVSIILIIFVMLTIVDIKEYLKSKNKVVSITKKVQEEPTYEEVLPSKDEKEYVVNNKNVEIIKTPNAILEESEIIFDEEKDLDPFFEEEEEVIVPTKDEIIYKEAMTQEEARAEIEKVEEQLKKEKDDSLLDTITNFEMEQEENAIISLDELMKVSDKLYESNEPVQYDDGDEPITIAEVIKKYNDVQNQKEEVKVVRAYDTVKDTTSDMFVEEDEDFLNDLEIAHNNLHQQ